ncbi:MAG: hypothetical protein AAF830_01855 [Pseudomonadota bacterium]
MNDRRIDNLLAELRGEKPVSGNDDAFYEALAQAQPEPQPVDEVTWARIKRSMQSQDNVVPLEPWWRKPSASPWQLAASLAAAVLLGVMIQTGTPVSDSAEEAVYATASQSQGEAALQVIFRPETTEADLRELLRSLDLRIIDGPSAIGSYTLALNGEGEMEEALSKLTKSPSIEYAKIVGDDAR